ncbi:helix-hairpin-helix domain-containing protein [Streptomyces sp. cmx-4-9]|uniref:helix-hairpin-helix domain-containing protein n=1 Tax=Streptomyces sp. cmx-4-9 TaxID=2790941 RepID=UPI0039811412
MTLHARSPHLFRTSGATSGPGRPRPFERRLRHRAGARRTAHPEPAALRRRAEALLGGSSPPRTVQPVGPVGPLGPAAGVARVDREVADRDVAGREPAGREVAGREPADREVAGRTTGPAGPAAGPAVDVGEAPAGRAAVPVGVTGAATAEAPGPVPAGAWASAVRDRLPLWLQARCGVEARAVGAVAVVLLVGLGFAAQHYWTARPEAVTAPAVVAPGPAPAGAPPPGPASDGTAALPGTAQGPPARIVVDVGGKVRDPGVRRLPAGSRVEDALAAAGGVRPGTDTTGLNRARVLTDGEQVLVGVPAQTPPGAAAPAAGPQPGPISLGSATVEQLDGLPGVGPVLAQHIVDFRTARGGFRSVEELRQVDGIGERRFADLRTRVRP